MREMVRQILTIPDTTMRTGGLAAMVLGVGVVWLARH
ncbi:DUF2065 family protein [Aurantimonas aggregata]|uniref:DUF2065 family protein n=1 Tax=Aurantimonas aggregata TaxID=2047720 RepID=A0A6L9MCF7_9HYPH|nr:DUF2065 domain-containing protein [Aurantimonas aggregata]NDV85493.1 DUF2065 family protein [Aurantimonas aggregata]